MIRKIFRKLSLCWLQMTAIRRKTACGNQPVPPWDSRVKREPIRQGLLPAGKSVPALPESRESALLRKIERIEKEAHSGCGQYYELYEPCVLRALRSLKDRLCPYDLEVFNRINRWDISDAAYAASCRAESEVWDEIRAGYD